MTNGTYYNVLCSHAFWFVTSHSVKSLERTFKSSWTVSDKSYIQWQSILNDSDFYQITAVQLENLTTDLRLLSRVKRFLIVLNKQKRDRKSIIATFSTHCYKDWQWPSWTFLEKYLSTVEPPSKVKPSITKLFTHENQIYCSDQTPAGKSSLAIFIFRCTELVAFPAARCLH